ncbi:MAG: FAD-dependent 5-carboxymethylaminomethyl-2-thiouridine(34) oxidoreductase MnmC [Pseudomonadota bacterium]
MRLPPRPDLKWKEDGTPVDERVGDVYYSVEDGLAESRAVFLAGCGLPEAWQGRANFTIGELGFGTGLNFLATWQRWRAMREEAAWLHFVSFEGFPLDREDAERALKPWPELSELAQKLCEKWPVRAKGVRQIIWPEECLTLTLHIGLIEETLPQSRFKADAWFLDGFSPAKNEAMCSEALWPLMAERSNPGARAATFTVAGAVRRGLTQAGFSVEKKPGHGRKRERLEAVFGNSSLTIDKPAIPRIAVIGAGISGACLAYALTQRGADVTLFDQADGLGQGTSGNPLALVMPRLDAADTVQARLLIDAYLSAQTFYSGCPGVEPTETVHRPRDEKEAARFQKVLADPPLGLEQLEALQGGGVLHKASMILRPSQLLPALLDGIQIQWGREAVVDMPGRSVNGEVFDVVILASGWHMAADLPELHLAGRLGQVEWLQGEVEAPQSALAAGHYALASRRTRLWGATFEDHNGDPPKTSKAAQDENRFALEALNPYWRQEVRRFESHSRAGIRATTADRLPLIGGFPNSAALAADRQRLERRQWQIDPTEYCTLGVYIAGGYGSRGFTWAPWAAALLTAQIFENPIPARQDALQAVAPNRQVLRHLKRSHA